MNEVIQNPKEAVLKIIELLQTSVRTLDKTNPRDSMTAYRSQIKTLEMVRNAGRAVLKHCEESAKQDHHLEELRTTLANAERVLANTDVAQHPVGPLNFLRSVLGRRVSKDQ